MAYQEIIQLILIGVIGLFGVLLGLIAKNILQHRKIYSFRSQDRVWDHWKSQVYGLILFILGFIGFTVLFFGYIFISHPEYFGAGLTLDILLQDPLENIIFIIFSFSGLVVAILGMFISINAIRNFIHNIEIERERT